MGQKQNAKKYIVEKNEKYAATDWRVCRKKRNAERVEKGAGAEDPVGETREEVEDEVEEPHEEVESASGRLKHNG